MYYIFRFFAWFIREKEDYQKYIYEWLNYTWKFLRKPVGTKFDKNSMKVYTPLVPTQENGYDCGIYVCRYMYAFFRLKDLPITFRDTVEEEPLKGYVTSNSYFQFTQNDITEFWNNIQSLIKKCNWTCIQVGKFN